MTIDPAYVEDPTDEDYARAAEQFVRERDLPRAMEQLAAALTFAPSSPSHLALFDRVLAGAKAPLLLAPVAEGTFFGLVAARARILAKVGRLDEAVHHLFQAVAFRPSVPYLPWALSWLEKRAAAKRVDAETVSTGAAAMLRALERAEGGPGVGSNLEAAQALAERVRAARGADELLGTEARLLEALGREGDATRLLEGAATATSSWKTWAALGAHRARLGEAGPAREAYSRAFAAAPRELSVALGLGDACLDCGELAQAEEAYGAVLAQEAEHPWARASLAFVRAVLGGGDEELSRRASGPQSERAAALLAEFRAYAPEVPLPLDPVSRVVRRALERARGQAEPGPIRLKVRTLHPEAPSAHVALRLGLARLGRAGSLEVRSDAPPVEPSLLDGLDAPEEATTAALVLALAGGGPSGQGSAGGAHGDLTVSELWRALAHPAALSAAEDAPRWVLRWQLACARLLVASDEGRAALARVLSGPDDLVVAAAVVALAESGRSEGFQALLDRASARPEDPPSYAHALAWCWLRLGGHDPERRGRLLALARRTSR